ncbi:MAG: hypothetical protein QOI36_5096, partial [Pseudonocardiales bacterium]|nr:hypothetical protein [Pseudonocardiales bacterium]
ARPLTVNTTGGRFTPTAVTVPLVCRLTTTCQGTLLLQNRKQGATARDTAAKKPKPPTRYGSTTFTIAAGKTAMVKVKLSTAGRALVRHQSTVTLYANATIGYRIVSAKIKLKKQKKSTVGP